MNLVISDSLKFVRNHNRFVGLGFLLIFVVIVCLLKHFYTSQESEFEQAFGFPCPTNISVKKELTRQNWQFRDYSYYATLAGDEDAFSRLAVLLKLKPSSSLSIPNGFPRLGEEHMWWVPPTYSELLENSSKWYCLTAVSYRCREEITLYFGTNHIFLYKRFITP